MDETLTSRDLTRRRKLRLGMEKAKPGDGSTLQRHCLLSTAFYYLTNGVDCRTQHQCNYELDDIVSMFTHHDFSLFGMGRLVHHVEEIRNDSDCFYDALIKEVRSYFEFRVRGS